MTILETPPDTHRLAEATLEAAVERLLDLQTDGGWWCGELESNVTMTAQHLFLLEFLRLRDEDTTRKIVNELLHRQRDDGTWPIYWGGEPDLAATIESYAALRMAGFDADDERIAGARRFIEDRGGIGASRVFTRIWLSLFGLWSWDEIPQLPPELVLMRPEMPISVYSFSCWARQTIVPLTVVMHYRPVRQLPRERLCHELNLGPAPRQTTLGKISDQLLARYARARLQPGREQALDYAERWIIDRQELDGSWGGIQPPWVWSLIALACRGHGPDSPYVGRGLAGWNRFLIDEDDRLRPEACQSPVWDTALALLGLNEAGRAADEAPIRRAVDWMVGEEVRQRGDWAVRAPGVEPGGWAFEYDNDLYPDIDDVSVIALALRGLNTGGPTVDRAIRWLVDMQSSDDGWGAFDRDNTAYWLYRIPFCDFGAIIDPPSVDVTAHCVELLATEPGSERAVERGLAYLLHKQEEDGPWFGRWGVNYIYGTGATLPALAAAGVAPDHPPFGARVVWLESVQNEDGGFGEDCRSYDVGDEGLAWHRRGESTPSQTAWALMGLVAAGEARSQAAARAVAWLAERQREDGDWDEQHFTGTGFPRDFLIRYHLYRIVWPVIALARFNRALA